MGCCNQFSSNDATPLPCGVVAAVFLIKFLLTINNIMSFSYLPQLVKSFNTPEEDVGYHVGLLGAALNIGWLLSYFFWGCIGDTQGRKRTLLVASFGAMITGLTFGFSTNFYWALCSRFLFGLNMGMTSVLKSILVLACDSTNTSLAFSIYYSGWALACLIGPSVAGFLVFPVEQYPGVFKKDSIFNRFKVLLPNIIVSLIWVFVFVLAFMLIPNDCPGGKEKELEEQSLLPQPIELTDKENNEVSKSTDTNRNNPIKSKKISTWKSASKQLLTKDFIGCVALYGMMSPIALFLDEIFPVFAATAPEFNGLGLSMPQIGIVFLGAAGILLPLLYLVIPRLFKCMAGRTVFIVSSLLQGVSLLLIPPVAGLSKATMIGTSVLTMGLNYFMLNTSEIAINTLVNNCSPASVLGMANSIAGTACLIGEITGPLVYGALYSWSMRNVIGVGENREKALGFPFNQYFVFFVASASCLVISAATKCLLSKKVEDRNEEYLEE